MTLQKLKEQVLRGSHISKEEPNGWLCNPTRKRYTKLPTR